VRAATTLFAIVALACGPEQPGVDEEWAAARARWHIERDPAAWDAWNGIDPTTPEGREARRLLAEAERSYRLGIEQVAAGDPEQRATFERAVRIGPMDPALYLPLARACRTAGEASPDNPHFYIRAAEYYAKFLVLAPDHPEADTARNELAEIDPGGTRYFDAPRARTSARAPEDSSVPWALGVALAALLFAVVAVFVLLRARPARWTLEELALRRPELHPALTYLVGSLRHELLKHRIGAVGDAVEALGGGRASLAEIDFLRGRLFGGEPLEAAWEGHLVAFERALGPELDVRRKDRGFRRAGRSIRTIAKLEGRVQERGGQLAKAHRELRELDRQLSRMVQRLVRTAVDGALFREVVDEVQSEYAAGRVRLEEIVIRAPSPAPMVEVFRVDLVLVLKNVVRNAILAVGRASPPRRIGLDVETEVELTGEETVRIHVRDTSDEKISTEDIYERRMDRGLGLVTAALRRYDGTISVEDGKDGWAKSVVVRFFRAFGEDDDDLAAP
jgi:tetratricopeptide (TPR) repeat protein